MQLKPLVSAIAIACFTQFSALSQTETGSEPLCQPMPQAWSYAPENLPSDPSDSPWWKNFDDAVLDTLIEKALNANLDIAQAVRRSEIARLSMQQAQSAYYPQISVAASYNRDRTSGRNANAFSLGAQMQWEIDVFGKIGQKVKAGKEALRASRADLQATRLAIAAQTATYYTDYRMLQTQLQIAEEHLSQQKRVVEITEARHEAGLVSKLDVVQAKTVYATTQASVPPLRCRLRQTLNSIALLLGVYPDNIEEMLSDNNPIPVIKTLVPIGFPAELLRRRPDIIASEATLAMYAAQTGVAKKDFLPTLSLKGDIGYQSEQASGLSRDGFYYSIGPTLSWNVFEGMSRKYALESARQQMLEAVDSYNLTVMTAVQEVDNALASYKSALDTFDYTEEAYQQSDSAFNLSMEQYKQGLTAFTNVVDAQIDRLTYANSMATVKANATIALIDLYKALGGSPEKN